MGKRPEKASAKGRLDKFYRLAKEQGYRSRASFKILQIDRQYDFLSRARCLIDLCAAPGSWLQVAAKRLPAGSIIIGVDLVPIRQIDRVTTFTDDITTESCRSKIRNELKDWKADVVTHDGAPNVGSNWLSDAYVQNELVLASLRLATDFLAPGGTFVTKVFRSKDYNSLLWVLNQLFSKVEATKPPASRNVSAEIFVVCLGYLAPKRLDPKLLSAKHVFKDLDVTAISADGEASTSKSAPGNSLNIFGPEKKRRRREGYADGDMTLFRSVPVRDFIESSDPIGVLSNANKLDFGADDKPLRDDEHTAPEILASCADLKVLGKSDFKALLKWRLSIRKALGMVEAPEEPEIVEEKAEVVEMDEDEQLQHELERLSAQEATRRRKERRKVNERKARDALKLQLNMTTNMDLGAERQDGLIDLGGMDDDALLLRDVQHADDASSDDESETASARVVEPEGELEEPIEYADALEKQFDEQYEDWLSRRDAKDAKKLARDLKRKRDATHDEWTGIGADAADSDEALDSDGEYSDAGSVAPDAPATAGPSRAAALWYDQPVFKSLGALLEPASAPTSKSQLSAPPIAAPAPVKSAAPATDDWSSDEEDAPASKRPRREDLGIVTAEAMTLASSLVNREKTKSQLVDDGFNRHAFNDKDDLPTWFLDDEAKAFRSNVPVTKEAVEIMRAKFRALNARPIKKIAEAKARKKMRASRRIQRMQSKAEVVANSADMSERDKATAISKLVANASKAPKHKGTKAEVKVVVARGANRGLKGRPRGTSGRYKMVDPRGKKDLRAEKRVAKAAKKGGKGKRK